MGCFSKQCITALVKQNKHRNKSKDKKLSATNQSTTKTTSIGNESDYDYVPNYQFIEHSLKPTILWGEEYKGKPLQTNKWWTNLVLNNGENAITLYPYLIRLVGSNTCFVCYPNMMATKDYVISPFVNNWQITFSSSLNPNNNDEYSRKLVYYDELSVHVNYSNSISSVKMILTRGSPYLTILATNSKLKLNTIHAILDFKKTSSTKYVVKLNNNQTWVVYYIPTDNNTQLNLDKKDLNVIESRDLYSGVIRIALVNEPSEHNMEILDKFSTTYLTKTTITYEFPNNDQAKDDNKCLIHFNFEKIGTLPLLLFILPHHLDTILNLSSTSLKGYKCIKGPLTSISGDQWTFVEPLNSVQFDPIISKAELTNEHKILISEALQEDIKDNNLTISEKIIDPYFYGKSLSKIARLAMIADYLGLNEKAQYIIEKVKVLIQPWLDGTNKNYFVYDNTYKGIVTKQGIKDNGSDFGNGYYNDHHFHYGYFVYAFSIIAKLDKNNSWTLKNKQKILLLIRDYANPYPNDKYFPLFRHKDFYDGHSWASGLFEFGDGKNQESTSEAIHSYYAMYLFCIVTNNTYLSNIANMLLSTELRSCIKYWHMTLDDKPRVFDNDNFNSNKTVGILWSCKADYATWFGKNAEFIHCIQMLPFTPISSSLLSKNWIRELYPLLSQSLERKDPIIDGGWKTYIFMALAIIDRNKALNLFLNSERKMDDGNTLTNTLFWILTQQQ